MSPAPPGLLGELYAAALDAVRGGPAVRRALERAPRDERPVVLLACGKAACAMAGAAVEVLGERLTGGAVHTREGHARTVPRLEVREAGHPLPDARSLACAEQALAIAASLHGDQRLLVLLSGGASAIWCAPAEGLDLDLKRATTDALLRGGASIAEINCVRRRLSRIKGGRLAAAAAGRTVTTLAISDVRGDAPADIGSGPTVADPTSRDDALAVLDRPAIAPGIPAEARRCVETEAAVPAAAGPGHVEIVACLDDALAAAEAAARARGLRARRVPGGLYGDVREVAARLVAALEAARAAGDTVLLCGGEPTVEVRGPGRGGRCQELAARLALALENTPGWSALCAGTDGADGPTDAAGALVDAGSVARARAAGRDPSADLARSDSHALLAASGDLVRTGPTDTNVTDLVLIRVGP